MRILIGNVHHVSEKYFWYRIWQFNLIKRFHWHPQQRFPKKKAKRLRIFTCNSQSIWNKKAELEHLPSNKNIDILIGTDTHVSCNIKNSEIIPPNYDAVRKDRNDGYGGAIIIHKNDFIVEEIQHSHK